MSVWGYLLPLDQGNQILELTSQKDEYEIGTGSSCDHIIKITNAQSLLSKSYLSCHFCLRKERTDSEQFVYIYDHSEAGTFVNGKKIGKGKRRLLEPCSEISLVTPENVLFEYLENNPEDQADVPEDVTNKYFIAQTLGEGAFGNVKLVFNKKDSSRLAMKCIPTSPYSEPGRNVSLETEIMKKLNHPCIIRIVDVCHATTCLYIIMELAAGGTLHERLRQDGKLSENFTRHVIYQVLLALEPDNILLVSSGDETLVKVTDFGVSKLVDEQTIMKTFTGTPCYIAPEIWKNEIIPGQYSNSVDLWSIGIVFYQCITGELPIIPNKTDSMRKVLLETFQIQGKFYQDEWEHVPLAEDLARKLLTVDVGKRITVPEALQHQWFEIPEFIQKIEEITLLPLQKKVASAISRVPEKKAPPTKPAPLTKVNEHSDSDSDDDVMATVIRTPASATLGKSHIFPYNNITEAKPANVPTENSATNVITGKTKETLKPKANYSEQKDTTITNNIATPKAASTKPIDGLQKQEDKSSGEQKKQDHKPSGGQQIQEDKSSEGQKKQEEKSSEGQQTQEEKSSGGKQKQGDKFSGHQRLEVRPSGGQEDKSSGGQHKQEDKTSGEQKKPSGGQQIQEDKSSGGQKKQDHKPSGGQQIQEYKSSGGQKKQEEKSPGGQQKQEEKSSGGQQKQEEKSSGGQQKQGDKFSGHQRLEVKSSGGEEDKSSGGQQKQENKSSGRQQKQEEKKQEDKSSGGQHKQEGKLSGGQEKQEEKKQQDKSSGGQQKHEEKKQQDKSSGGQHKQEGKPSGGQQKQEEKKQQDKSSGGQQKHEEKKQEDKSSGEQHKQEDKFSRGQHKQEDKSSGGQPKQEEKSSGGKQKPEEKSLQSADFSEVESVTWTETSTWTVKSVKHPRLDKYISLQDAQDRGILNLQENRYTSASGKDYTLAEALSTGAIIAEPNNTITGRENAYHTGIITVRSTENKETKSEGSVKVYAVRGVSDVKNQKLLSFSEALRQGIIIKENGNFRNTASGETVDIESALRQGYYKGHKIRDPNSLEIDPVNHLVVEMVDVINSKVVKPLKVIKAFKTSLMKKS